jgi:hypothetical protein
MMAKGEHLQGRIDPEQIEFQRFPSICQALKSREELRVHARGRFPPRTGSDMASMVAQNSAGATADNRDPHKMA